MIQIGEKQIDASTAARRLGMSRATFYELMRSSNPPPAYRTGTRRLRFYWSEIEEWWPTCQLQPRPRTRRQS